MSEQALVKAHALEPHGGLRFVGVDGNPDRQFDTDWNNFAPRFGFAYSANPCTPNAI